MSHLAWRKIVPSLVLEFRCITPDWPLSSHTIPMADDADKISDQWFNEAQFAAYTDVGRRIAAGALQVRGTAASRRPTPKARPALHRPGPTPPIGLNGTSMPAPAHQHRNGAALGLRHRITNRL